MIDLAKLDAMSAPRPVAPTIQIDLGSLVAEPNFAPRDWQTVDPRSIGMAPNWGGKDPIGNSGDLQRILQLPRRPMIESGSPAAIAIVQMITERFSRYNAQCVCKALAPERNCIKELKLAQAWALYEIGIVGGLLGPIGVGHGKTILDLLAPLALRGCRLALLLVPPGLVAQLIAEYQFVGQHFRMPSLVVHGRDWTNVIGSPNDCFQTRTVEFVPTLHVLPYSRLSRPESTTFLNNLQPDAIIADEAHKLRHADTATTSRVLRYFAAHPDTRFCGWTGSLTDSSVKDYAHLSAMALRHGSPLPLDPDVVEEWSKALDPVDWPAPMGALVSLCAPGEHVHDGFRRRLRETPGVVSTSEPAVAADLSIEERDAPEIPVRVEAALNELRATWMRPDGEELVDPLAVARCAWELACGFYYRWIFPPVAGVEQRVVTILEWLEARKCWNRELREKLKERSEHLDSPMLCARAAARAWGDDIENAVDICDADRFADARETKLDASGLPLWKAASWPRWKKARGTVHVETEAVRIDDYLARDAALWGSENLGIIWFQHKAFGEWVAELSGLPLHAGGPKAGEILKKEKGNRSIIASIKSHGTGRDGLQFLFAHQLVANPPSSATEWEQLLGRLHRIGQKADTVHAEFYRHTPELAAHVDQALKRALYVQGTLGSVQKLRTGWRL